MLFGDLFTAVQSAALFDDEKAFADATPRQAPADILAHYHAERPDSKAALERFVRDYFELPAPAGTPVSLPQQDSMVMHIDRLWPVLIRSTPTVPPHSSLLPLPKPYVVPGGRFREIYYWDSYFTMLGLQASGRPDLVTDMVEDFAHLIDTYHHIPNGTRTYYLSRSQPPFFFAMAALLSQSDPASAFARYLPELRREYAFWMEGSAALRPGEVHRRAVAMPDGSILNRYWDDRDTPRDESYTRDVAVARASGRPASEVFRDIRAAAESGWDFSSRWLGSSRELTSIATTQVVPVDLNSLLFGLESAIRAGCERGADQACAREFAKRAGDRRAAIDRYLWEPALGAYVDYRWTERVQIKQVSAATVYPLFVSLASRPQAVAVAATVDRDLLKSGGIVTTTVTTGQQWDAPNGWAPLQWVVIAGLRSYDQNDLAARIACHWLVNVGDAYRRTGKLVEKYDVIAVGRGGSGGEYPLQDGFGWTNGVTRLLTVLYSGAAALTAQDQCGRITAVH